ncbi:unnamed protein product [Chondrus crispus]|uniref:Proteasome subunit beta n=1 Tax=Chondrus crispus TaxID=2769 RepID=R7QJL5_CHOCR|nr:unnamed protein product [Chondrus crispus]CDF37595.1 unnamed protein product [Chondrus crispus]|eukprot:XP_005717466.1 unnamed protein product [Chondrus crispus]
MLGELEGTVVFRELLALFPTSWLERISSHPSSEAAEKTVTMSGFKLTSGSGRFERDANVQSSASGEPIRHTQRPMVTGSSVIAMRCVDGVVIGADTLASYGSMARFRKISRLHKATDMCVVGAGGDLSDFQQLTTMVDKETNRDYCFNDGHGLSPKAIHQYVARVMYNRRNKMDPLWNYVVIAGMQNGDDGEEAKPVLGLVDLVGTHFESEVIATGFGEYLGLPLLRKAYREDITVAEGKKVVEQIMKVLFYRDARTIDRVQIATVTKDGVDMGEPFKLETEWSYKAFVDGARAGDMSTW